MCKKVDHLHFRNPAKPTTNEVVGLSFTDAKILLHFVMFPNCFRDAPKDYYIID